MIRNNIRFAIRNMMRNKVFTAINVVGLAISLTAFILMALYIESELSFDRFHANADRIYRVADDKETPGVLLEIATSAAPVAPALKEDFPEIQEAVRMIKGESLIKYGDKLFEERNLFYADPNIFKVFTFKTIKGNTDKALEEPMSIVLTSAMAEKYFGAEDPIGKIVSADGKNMKVTSVIDNVPGNSHLQFDFLISMATAEAIRSGYDWLFTNWYSNNFYTYLLLPEGYDATKLVSKLGDFDKRHRQNGSSAIHHYALEKLTDIYLHSKRNNQAGKTGSITNLYIFSSVAIFMLLIACINFVNLSTARSVIRAKEVGVKKVAGASRAQVITQFFSESFLMSATSLLLAIAAVSVILPYFNTFSGKLLSIDLFSPFHLLVLFILLLIIGLLSGTYPAIVLSAYKPVAALKGKASASILSISVRKALVIFQFAISVILIICSTVVFTQLQYMQQHDLGFKPSQTMVINFEGDKAVQTKYKTIRQELLGIPGIQSITASSNVPGDGNVGSWSMNFAKKNGDTLKTELSIYLTDFTFLQQYNIPMVAGRAFSEQYAADTTESMLINETALRKLGFSSAAEAIGVKVDMYPKDAKVIGVYKDFHFQSLQKAVEPLAMRILPRNFRLLSIQIESLNVRQTVEAIEKEWKQLVPERPMEFTFLDESFNKQYDSEIKFAQVFSVFTTIAIIIACLGLFGLALFSVQQRTKEIGIRKVLGASIVNIGAMLSKDFIVLVVVAILVASPIGWYAMNRWLQDFEYRISISWWIFILAGVAAIMIAVLTICYHTIKAGMANPATSLRTE